MSTWRGLERTVQVNLERIRENCTGQTWRGLKRTAQVKLGGVFEQTVQYKLLEDQEILRLLLVPFSHDDLTARH